MSLLLAPGHGVVCLARWLSTPTTTSKQEPAAASGEVVHKPSAFEAECIKLSEGGDMKPLASKLRVALLEQLADKRQRLRADNGQHFDLAHGAHTYPQPALRRWWPRDT